MAEKTSKGTVLIVDDDDTILSMIDMVLSYDGFNCVGAMNGEQALKLVDEINPALVLLDLSMPKMDGKEFCRWLRTHGHAELPVVIMTAGQDAEKTCEEVGAQACLIKPFDVSDLQTAVRKWTAAL